jgi:hypothetical protein
MRGVQTLLGTRVRYTHEPHTSTCFYTHQHICAAPSDDFYFYFFYKKITINQCIEGRGRVILVAPRAAFFFFDTALARHFLGTNRPEQLTACTVGR